MKKIALLVECGRDGLEAIVCKKICNLIEEEKSLEIQINITPMDNKRNLIEACGTVTANLLKDGYERIIILWDERPAWPTFGETLCLVNERETILKHLKSENISDETVSKNVRLVCIEREFESWLLFDHKMLERVLSTPEHLKRIQPVRNPDKQTNPKSAMMSIFKKCGKQYVDVRWASRIAKCLDTLNCLRKCETFKRFEDALTDFS